MLDMSRLKEQSEIHWKSHSELTVLFEVYINDQMVAWMEPRPMYCDRGHWKVECNLPDIDPQDGFPRYYMSQMRAIDETDAFLRWRLWKIRSRP